MMKRTRPASAGARRARLGAAALVALALGVVAAGCGGGSGGGGGGTAGPAVSGKVVAGTVANATVRVFQINPDRTLTLVAEGTTDANGSYTLAPPGSGPFLVLAGGGTYTDEATGQTRTLATPPAPATLDSPRPGTLEAIIGSGVDATPVAVSLTPLSTFAARRAAESSVGDFSALAETAVAEMNEDVAEEFGLGAGVDPRSIAPLDFGDPANASAIAADPDSPAALLGAVLAGLSRAASDLGLSDPLDLIDALADDFSDGVFNGQSDGQPVQLDGSPLSPSQATTDLAASTQDYLDSPQNASSTTSGDFDDLITSVQTQDVAPPGVNRAPSFDGIADVLVANGAGAQQLTITAVSPGSGEAQTVTVTATSSVPAVVADPASSGSGTTRTLSFTPLTIGTTTITVTAQDDGGTSNGGVNTATRTFVIVVGTAPAITSAPPPTDATLGVLYAHTVTSTGTPTPTLSLSGNPPWLTLSAGGTLSGTPGAAHVGVASSVILTASNGLTPAATESVTITVFAPPAIASTPGAQATVGTQYTYTIQVTGFPAPALQVTGLPPWLLRTGDVLQGTPAVGDLGLSGTITVTAQDNGHGADAVQSFQINVNPQLPAGQWDGSNWDAASWGN